MVKVTNCFIIVVHCFLIFIGQTQARDLNVSVGVTPSLIESRNEGPS
jgi:hypothetical protein